MNNLQRYQGYRLRRRSPLRGIGRLIGYGLIVLLLVLLWNALRGGGGKKTDDTTNISPLANGAIANGNVNPLNANASAAVTSTITTAKCPGVISQYGEKKRMVLTFNGAGTSTGSVEKIRDALKQASAQGTFFLTGTWIEKNPELAKSLAEAGFGVYNYTFDKPHPEKLTPEQLAEQLTKAEQVIVSTVGKNPRPFFRPPYGEFNDSIVATTKAAGYCVIHWTVDALDWQDGQTVDGSKQRVLDKARPGGIVLMNVASDIVADLAPALITELRSQGYDLVSLEALLGN